MGGYEYEVTFRKRPLGYFNVISEKFFMGALRDSKGSIGAVVSDRKLKHAEVKLKAWSIVDKVNGEQVRTKTYAEILELLKEVPVSQKAPVKITFVVPLTSSRRRAVLELWHQPNRATRLVQRMAKVIAERA